MARRYTDNPPSPAVKQAVATIQRLLVNRKDRYGAYWLKDRGKPEQRVPLYTAPWPRQLRDADRKGKSRPFLGEWQLRDHVELAPFPGSPIGVHAISEKDTCKWIALDIDRHSDDIPLDVTRDRAIYLASLRRGRQDQHCCDMASRHAQSLDDQR